ncbi:MAG: ABC transporter ATP-binding protein [Acetatifactor sp.]
MADKRKILEIHNLDKAFSIKGDKVPVLKNIDLDVEEGEFISIVGPSGCGKSTLLKMIMSLNTIDTGEIRIDGIPVSTPSEKCSMIFQEARLMPWLTVEKNIEFVIPKTVPKEKRKQLVDKNIDLVGLSEFRNALPGQLSGGMQQRVSIARGLVTNPDLLLLDEPFGALDAFTRMNMQTELLNIWKIEKTTMILVTHDIDEAIFLSTKILIMSERPGQIKKIITVPLLGQRDRSSEDFLNIRRMILQEFFGRNEKMLEYYI